MHPAYSVIFFTTASGAGYGLLFWLSLAHVFGMTPESAWWPLVALIVALALATGGLLASMLHLGRPERAFRAFSQWRSSWLSREGVAAVATYLPSGLLALLWMAGVDNALTVILAALSAIGAAVTVYCTAMIYASLKTVRQWHLRLVPAIYLAQAAASGALLLALFLSFSDTFTAWAAVLTILLLLVALGLKLRYFRHIDGDAGQYTDRMALGMGADVVRQLEPPHTRPNFVMREMGYEVARRHALRLRRIVLLCLFAAPLALVLVAALLGAAAPVLLILAAASAAFGLVVERWLFFAEAEHVSMLYYGKTRA